MNVVSYATYTLSMITESQYSKAGLREERFLVVWVASLKTFIFDLCT